jgi:hypothetical protein
MQAYFEATPFGALLEDGPPARELRLPHFTLQFAGPLFDALLATLARGASTVGALAERPELAPFGARAIRDAILRLALGGLVWPMLEPTPSAPVSSLAEDEAALLRVPSAYNRMVLQQPLAKDSPILLASAVAGTGLSIPMLEAVAIRLLTEVPPADRPRWIRELFHKQPFRLTVKDRPVEDAEGLVRLVLDEVARVRTERVGRLVALGVLERAP